MSFAPESKPKKKVSSKKRTEAAVKALKEKAENSKPDPKKLGTALLVYRPENAVEGDPLSGVSLISIYAAGYAPSEAVLAVHQKLEPESTFKVVTL